MKANMKRMAVAILAMLLTVSTALAGCGPKSDIPEDAVLDKIELVDGYQKEYRVDEKFKNDIKIKATYSPKGSEELDLTATGVTYTPNPLTFDTAGEKELTISYKYKEVTKSVTAKFNVVDVKDEELTVSMFDWPKSYANYRLDFESDAKDKETNQTLTIADHAKTGNRDKFMVGGGIYKVGYTNGFRFMPDARGLNEFNKEHPFKDIKTTFEIYVKDSESADYPATPEANPDQYVFKKDGKGQNNIYYFKEAAEGKIFKLVVKPDESCNLEPELVNPKIEAEFQVVDGYNVYDLTGFSVLDNLNVKHWKAIKELAGTLDWDDKPLVEYNVLAEDKHNIVKQIILHDNITIEPDQLPDNYFWDAERKYTKSYSEAYGGGLAGTVIGNQGYTGIKNRLAGYAATKALHYDELLDGSLRDYEPNGGWNNFNTESNGDYAELYAGTDVNMQKAVYNAAGTGIEGNCMQITIKAEGNNHKLYTVFDGTPDTEGTEDVSPLSHWSLIKYTDEGVIGRAYPNLVNTEGEYEFSTEPVVRNVRITGDMPRKSETEGMPARLMAFNTCVDNMHLENAVVSKLFVAVTSDQATNRSNVDIKNCKIVDIYSNMFYSWRSDNKVTHSVLQDAGGPLFLLCDGSGRCDNPERDWTDIPGLGAKMPVDYDKPANESDTNYGPRLEVDEESVLESKAAGYEPWYVLNNVSEMFGQIKGGNNDGLADVARGYLGREVVHKDDNGIELINVIAAIICEPGDLMAEKNYYENIILVNGSIQMGNEEFEMLPTFPKAPGMLGESARHVLYASNAPIFASSGRLAIYGGDAMASMSSDLYGFGGSPIATTTGGDSNTWATNIAGVYGAWATGDLSPYLFITMRAKVTMNGATSVKSATPRFGILIGSATRAAAPQA